MKKQFVHRFIPNSAPGVRDEMLKATGYKSVEEIFEEIPEELRFNGDLDLPKEPVSEMEVGRRIEHSLSKNRTTQELLSFLGAGSWLHYVPALCAEITGRSEFLTAYAGGDWADHGRYQAMFEYQSMIGDLLAMDVVSAPVYDGTTAAGDALHIASRATGRREILIPSTISPNTLSTIKNYSDPWLDLKKIDHDPRTGIMDLEDLKGKLSTNTAAVFVENPSYLGFIEEQCEEISHLAHESEALLIASINPVSLGLLAAPGDYGADIACGEGQPFGMTQSCGGATMGILAVNDSDRFLNLLPSFLVGISDTIVPGELAFSWHTLWDRMLYTTRDHARSFTGTSSWLWGISAAVYMSLLGFEGIKQLGKTNMQNTQYAIKILSKIPEIKTPIFSTMHFNEFVINFDGIGKTAKAINEELLKEGILGGKDLSIDFPDLGQSALYCVTEMHQKKDIDRLADVLSKIIKRS
ncbi:aminomethyl-transferring glycine dehydrogenase subunit GcvPA [Chloroflexota bacterium]